MERVYELGRVWTPTEVEWHKATLVTLLSQRNAELENRENAAGIIAEGGESEREKEIKALAKTRREHGSAY